MTRREVADLHIVIGAFCFKHECRLAVHFRGDHLHLIFRQMIRIQHHDCWIATEALTRERVDVEQPATATWHKPATSMNSPAFLWRKCAASASGAGEAKRRLATLIPARATFLSDSGRGHQSFAIAS